MCGDRAACEAELEGELLATGRRAKTKYSARVARAVGAVRPRMYNKHSLSALEQANTD